jgi:hypothetical protein
MLLVVEWWWFGTIDQDDKSENPPKATGMMILNREPKRQSALLVSRVPDHDVFMVL